MSRVRTVVVLLVGAVVAWHLLVVTTAALPAESTPQALRPPSGHLLPFFRQDWRLFAPNPVASDRSLLVQPAWRDGEGEVEVGDWVDVTDIELDTVRQHLVGGRGGYGTNRLTFSLDQQWTGLLGDQKAALSGEAGTSPESPADRAQVDELLSGADAPEYVRDGFIDTDDATIRLATDVLRTLEPDRELVAVRYAVENHAVRRWEDRDAETRPEPSRREGFWWVPAEDDPDRRAAIADYVRRHQ